MTLYWNVWQFDMVLRVIVDLSFSWRFQFTFLSVLEKWFFLFLLHCHISVYISQNITGYRYGWSNFSLYLSASFKLFSKSSKCFFCLKPIYQCIGVDMQFEVFLLLRLMCQFYVLFNRFAPTLTFLYPRKHSKRVMFSDVFRIYRNITMGTNGLKLSHDCVCLVDIW